MISDRSTRDRASRHLKPLPANEMLVEGAILVDQFIHTDEHQLRPSKELLARAYLFLDDLRHARLPAPKPDGWYHSVMATRIADRHYHMILCGIFGAFLGMASILLWRGVK